MKTEVGAKIRKNPFQDLDWTQLLSLTAEQTRTPYGKIRIQSLNEIEDFATTPETAQELQAQTNEAYALIEKEALWGPLRGLDTVHDELEILEKGGVLEAAALNKIRSWLQTADSWIQFPNDLCGKNFRRAKETLFNPREVLRVLDQVLTPRGELSERASSKLQTLTNQIREIRKEMNLRMDSLIQTYSGQGLLQEKFSDVRDGRFVVPVKVSEQSKVEGRVTELSVSKQTVFIEPKEMEVLNSKLRRLEADESEEIFSILTGVAKQLYPWVDSIGGLVQTIAFWDATQAKARIALKYGGRPILLSPDRSFQMKMTVNPLLFWSLPEAQIVRNTIDVSPPQQMILLSGPNTGGKTVLLKTLGLAALAARTGFFFPGSEPVRVPFFDSFFIDLGDPQSIENHVSSFSGHVLKMRSIVESMGPRSLILVDEMNSATDPEEGAALSRALVETILSVEGVILVATTHDPRLKIFGMNDPRILNASILFDEGTLHPTYRIVFGAPGRSRALETAERLGLPKAILDLAKSYLSGEHQKFESTLQQFQIELASQERLRRELNHAREEAEKLKNQWETTVKVEVKESIEKARQKLKHVLELAQIEVRETVKKIQSASSHKNLDEIRGQLNEVLTLGEKQIESSIVEAAPELSIVLRGEDSPRLDLPHFEAGVWVRVPKWKNVGEIVEWDGKKARVALGMQTTGMGKAFVVSVFPMEMEVLTERELRTLRGVQGLPPAGKNESKVKIHSEFVGAVPEFLDLRGQRLEEAMSAAASYLDRAYRSGRSEVTIIHGLGTGALREGIRASLADLDYVSRFQDSGTPGATRVIFKV